MPLEKLYILVTDFLLIHQKTNESESRYSFFEFSVFSLFMSLCASILIYQFKSLIPILNSVILLCSKSAYSLPTSFPWMFFTPAKSVTSCRRWKIPPKLSSATPSIIRKTPKLSNHLKVDRLFGWLVRYDKFTIPRESNENYPGLLRERGNDVPATSA